MTDALREAQLGQLEILRELARRCEAASLRWFVLGGTLLGAVRHGGFIPWDDDIDIGMPRPDYEQFADLCRRSSDPQFAWQSAGSVPGYPFAYGKLVLVGSHAVDPAVAHLPVRPGLFVDVFPIDGAPASRLGQAAHAIAVKAAVTAVGARIRRTGLRRIVALPLRLVPQRQALRLLGWMARRLPFDGSPFAVNVAGAWGYRRECQPRERFVPVATLPFEGLAVAAPGGWDRYLGRIYGDYRQLPPPDARRPRHGLTARGEPVAPRGPRRRAVRTLVRALVARAWTLVVRAGFAVGRLRPPRPGVVLATRDVGHPGGNLVAIQRALSQRLPGVPVRVVGYRTRDGLRGRIATAREAFAMGYHLAASRLFVADDWCFPLYAAWPRRGTFRVQVWHAAGAFKRFGFSVLERVPGGDDDSRLLPMTANWDLCLASSAIAADHLTGAFRVPRERISSALGLPRTDAFYDPAHRARATSAVRRRYALPGARRVLLYAPTFRGESIRDARHTDDLDLALLRDTLGAEWVVLLRLHPLVPRPARPPEALDAFVIDVSDWPDMNELLLVADLLVTDYSSAVFEFALLGRPMAFFTPDLAAYRGERGFYLEVPGDLPGPAFHTTRELAAFVVAGRYDLDAVRAFARTWFDVADGHATDRFLDRVAIPALRGETPDIEPQPSPEARVVVPVPGP